QRGYLLRRQHAIEARALYIEDLAFEGQNGLKMPITTLFGAAAGALTLDDVDLADRRIFALAIREFARERRHVEHALSNHFTRLARGLTGFGRDHGLLDDFARRLRVLFQIAPEVLRHRSLDGALHFTADQLGLRL